jgi:hypothetical protein
MTHPVHRRQSDRLELPDRSGAPLAIRELPSRLPAQRSGDRRDDVSREAVRRRVRAEFEEMQGLRLALPQAQRLFGLRADVCGRVLNELIEQKVLVRVDDRYCRSGVA